MQTLRKTNNIYLWFTTKPKSKCDLDFLKSVLLITNKFTCLLKCDWKSSLTGNCFFNRVRKNLYLLENNAWNKSWIVTQANSLVIFPLAMWRLLSKATSNQGSLVLSFFCKNVSWRSSGSLAKVISVSILWSKISLWR